MVFSSLTLGNKTFKNRLIMLPIVTNYANVDGSVSQKNIDFYAIRHNLAAIIVEAAYVHHLGKCFTNQLGIDSDNKINGLKQLSHTIQKESIAGIQLAAHIKSKNINDLTLNEIEEIKEAFLQAATRAIQADFELVEIHCAHGWLLSQFLSPHFNKRIDIYSQNFENRTRLPLEIIKKTRDLLKDQLLSVRINATDFLSDGINLDEAITFVKTLESIGIDIINVSAGSETFYHVSPMSYPKGFLLDFAYKIKLNTKLLVITANKLNDLELANQAILQSKADFIGLARALIADNTLAIKWQQKDVKAITPCLSCNQACIASIQSQKELSCVVNPQPYKEKHFESPFMYKRKIMIVGAGPAGIACAIYAKFKGLKPVIFEKHSKIGGQINFLINSPHKQEFKRLLDYFDYQIKKLSIPIIYNTNVNIELMKSENSAVVVFACGSKPFVPSFAQNNEFVVTADEVLEFGLPQDSSSVAVIGGGLTGLDVANTLAAKNIKVSVFEQADALLKATPYVIRAPILQSLNQNIQIYLKHEVINIDNHALVCNNAKHILKNNFDYFILASGRKSDKNLSEQINFCIDTVEIGDAKNIGDIQKAINDAYETAQIL